MNYKFIFIFINFFVTNDCVKNKKGHQNSGTPQNGAEQWAVCLILVCCCWREAKQTGTCNSQMPKKCSVLFNCLFVLCAS
jgi:hypothetical protein